MRKITFIALIILVSFTSLFSLGGDPGSSTATYLMLGLDARASGMGYAYTAVGEDIDTLFWNPAGLSDIPSIQLTTTYARWFEGINFQHIAGVFPFGKYGTLCGDMTFYKIPGIEVRGGDGDSDPDRIEDASSVVFGGSYSIGLGKYFSFGTNFKYIKNKIVDADANAIAFDIGILFDSPFSFGFVIKNIGTKMKYIDVDSPLPLYGRLGFALKLLNNNLILSTDLEYDREKNFATYHGFEWTLTNTITPRFGYIWDRDNIAQGYTFGVGVQVMGLSIDYATVPYGQFGLTHRVTVSYAFGAGKEGMTREIQKLAAEELAKKEILMSDLLYDTGINYYNEGKYEDAINAWDLTLVWNPEHEEANDWIKKAKREKREEQINRHIKRGKDFAEFERYSEAILEWQKALEIEPENFEVQQLLSDAEDELLRRQRLKQKQIQELAEKALDYYKRGNYKSAIDQWEEILYIDPTNAEARTSLEDALLRVKEVMDEYTAEAQRYENVGNWAMAVQRWRDVLNLDPTDITAKDGEKRAMGELAEQISGLISTGRSQYSDGKLEAAEVTFLRVLELSPSNSTAQSYLGDIRSKYEEGGDKEEDVDYYQIYLSGINAYTSHNYQTAVNLWQKIPSDNKLYDKAQTNIKRAKDILAKLEE